MKIQQQLLYSQETWGILGTGREGTLATAARHQAWESPGQGHPLVLLMLQMKYDFVVHCNRISLVCAQILQNMGLVCSSEGPCQDFMK